MSSGVRRSAWSFAALVLGAVLVSCSAGDKNACGGIVEPLRVLTPTPASLTLDAGTLGQVTASPSGGCVDEDRSVTWTSSDGLIATVDAAGKVTALSGGTATLTATAFGDKARTTIPVTVRALIASTIDARPDADTLSPLGTLALSATVKDQNGAVLAAAPIAWRSLTPGLASVTPGGLMTAIANGSASIEAATPRIGLDSLRDTVRVLIVTSCSLVRNVQIGSTINGVLDASSCQNLFGFRVANQYAVTAAVQTYYSIRLVPSAGLSASLVPLNISSGLYGLPAADTATTAHVVIRPGTFGFMVTTPTPPAAPRGYSVVTELNPDPRLSCVVTDATAGVTFRTALTPGCGSREVRILPALASGQQFRATGTAAGFPVTLELLNANTRVVLQRSVATGPGAVATVQVTNGTATTFVIVRVSNPASSNDLVTLTISP
jgi:Bacterial Ig-like domain (group 2)